ncbi:hypothetical protein A2Y83_01110 [Candidatus Falkowbacteria bacterium RBG_13_39_14]|uniref:KilA-N DNA-binding domain-containing protein n=1 Tax=Candidatus Falkowbacteria bacterium RBG_13_39_14 TaxID=1797985 RepID=A0A1F5S7C3_9BACT|nr:MAG: hypothetical protein A2Y83_01110 [Candidatus Falkowbacteria bacterium RBG_13_39_14]
MRIEKSLIPQEVIENRIFIIRDKKVMLDRDLAILYGVETKILKRTVKRNLSRFPADFMFELTREEADNLRCQIGTSSWGGTRYLPYAFSEHGILMLSSVLNSDKAVKINIQIMRIFIKMREMAANFKENREMINEMRQDFEGRFSIFSRLVENILKDIKTIYRLLDTIEEPREEIGFRDRNNEEK